MDIFLLKSLNKKAVLLKNFKKLLSKLRNTFVRRVIKPYSKYRENVPSKTLLLASTLL